MKIVCISNGPLPYHTPIFNALACISDLEVIYMSLGHPLRSFQDLWGETPKYKYIKYWSFGFGSNKSDFRSQISLGVSIYLSWLSPDVIFFNSWGPLVFEPILWKLICGRKALMWAESTIFSGLLRGHISDLLRRKLLSKVDAFVANGSCANEYLRYLGVSSNKIVTSCLPASDKFQDFFSKTNFRHRERCQPRFLFVGRLIHRKRPFLALEAFRRVLSEISEAYFTIVGIGPLEEKMRQFVKENCKNVEMLGRIEGENLKRIMTNSDILLVPSVREVWGLVINEALSQGMYVIASNQVGSAYDLLDDANRCGRIVAADNVEALTNAMIASCSESFDEVARNERKLSVANCTAERFAEDIFAAASLATKVGA